MTEPKTIAECDKEIAEYWKAMKSVSPGACIAMRDQVDRILEIRHALRTREKRGPPSQR